MLIADTVVLRPLLSEDGSELFRIRNDVELQLSLMSLPRANSQRRVDEWVEKILDDPHNLFFIIADRHTNGAIGFVQLTRMDFVHGRGELGICLVEKARGKGCAREALRLLEEYARDVFRMRKFVLHVLASNKRAISLYVKAGYVRVGTLRQHWYQRQVYHDVVVMEKILE